MSDRRWPRCPSFTKLRLCSVKVEAMPALCICILLTCLLIIKMRTPETLVRVKVSYTMVARGWIWGWCLCWHWECSSSGLRADRSCWACRHAVGCDSRRNGNWRGMFTVTSYDVSTCQCHLSPRSLTGNAARTSRYLYNEILAFCDNNVLYEVCLGPGPSAHKGIHWQWQ